MNNSALNQVRIKEKKNFMKGTLNVYAFFWKLARGLSEVVFSLETFQLRDFK